MSETRTDSPTNPAQVLPARAGLEPEIAIRVRDVVVAFGEKVILKGLDLDVRRGEVLGFVGGSGTGKSVLTRTILGLVQKRSGLIEVFGENLDEIAPDDTRRLEVLAKAKERICLHGLVGVMKDREQMARLALEDALFERKRQHLRDLAAAPAREHPETLDRARGEIKQEVTTVVPADVVEL